MAYLVIGAGSYSGRYMVNKLIADGDKEIIAVDTTGLNFPISPKLVCETRDFNNRLVVEEFFNKYHPNKILLFSGFDPVNSSFEDPVGTIMSTMRITLNTLEAVRSRNPNAKIVIVSSGEVYGSPLEEDPRKEEGAFLRPQSPLASAKACSEKVAYQYNLSYNMRTIIVRPFGIIGPDLDSTLMLGDLAKQLATIKIKNTEAVIYTDNIEIERDFLDIQDIVEAYSLLFKKGVAGEIYNICAGKIQPIRWLLDEMIRYSGIKVEVRTTPASDHVKEIPILGGDNSKIRNEIGWHPKTNLADTLHKLYDYWEAKIIKDSKENKGA